MAKGFKTGGREKGTPNRATAQAREAIAEFVDGNIDRLNDWLDKIENEDGPKAAFQCFAAMLEYNVPKLQRMELSGDAGKPQIIVVNTGISGEPGSEAESGRV